MSIISSNMFFNYFSFVFFVFQIFNFPIKLFSEQQQPALCAFSFPPVAVRLSVQLRLQRQTHNVLPHVVVVLLHAETHNILAQIKKKLKKNHNQSSFRRIGAKCAQQRLLSTNRGSIYFFP